MDSSTSKPLTVNEFLQLVKVIRMLYGVQLADKFFKSNMQMFTGFSTSDLQRLAGRDTVQATHEN